MSSHPAPGVAPFASEIVSELLADGSQREALQELRADYATGCAALCAALDAACFEFVRPRGGYFVWVRLPEGVSATALLPVCERHGVAFLPGPRCAPGAEGEFEQYARLCFALHEPPELAEGVRRLAAAVAEVRGA